MKFSKYLLAMAASMAVSGVFAGPVAAEKQGGTVFVTFETEHDSYADGTAVTNGEWYALCWSPTETFGGLTLECEPVNKEAGERVLIAISRAKDGRCPYIVFQVPREEAPKDGHYFVYLLDTRNVNGEVAAPVSIGGGYYRPQYVNGSAVSENYVVEVSSWAETAVDETMDGYAQAHISAIDASSDIVQLTVSGMMPGVMYNVRTGEEINNLGDGVTEKNYAVKLPKTSDDQDAAGNVYFYVPKASAKFFKVVRHPLEGVKE